MKISVKLMATLRAKLPPEAKGAAALELADGATVRAVFEHFGIPLASVHAVMLNDAIEWDRERPLSDGDALVLIPPVAGGSRDGRTAAQAETKA